MRCARLPYFRRPGPPPRPAVAVPRSVPDRAALAQIAVRRRIRRFGRRPAWLSYLEDYVRLRAWLRVRMLATFREAWPESAKYFGESP